MFQKPPYVSKIKMFPKNLFCFQKKICLEKVIIFTKSLTFSETYFCLEKGLLYSYLLRQIYIQILSYYPVIIITIILITFVFS